MMEAIAIKIMAGLAIIIVVGIFLLVFATLLEDTRWY